MQGVKMTPWAVRVLAYNMWNCESSLVSSEANNKSWLYQKQIRLTSVAKKMIEIITFL